MERSAQRLGTCLVLLTSFSGHLVALLNAFVTSSDEQGRVVAVTIILPLSVTFIFLFFFIFLAFLGRFTLLSFKYLCVQ